MTEPTLRDCINYMKQQLKGMEKYPKSYEFNIPYYRKTIELLEESRPHGEWIFKNDNPLIPTGYWECSGCKKGRLMVEENFCPNCGADMRNRERKEKALENLASAKTVTDPSRRVEMVCDLIRKKKEGDSDA